MIDFLLALAVAFLASWLLTPVVRRLALRYELVDRPDTQRKMHSKITPLGGGVAVFLATLIGAAAYLLGAGDFQLQGDDVPGMVWLVLASFIICLVGLADDRWGLKARQKLVGQIIAIAILMSGGLMIRSIALLGWQIELGLLAIPFTLFWLLGAINSLNLIDGADGLASTVGIVLSLSIASMALLMGQEAEAAVALALAGALAGFLIFNFPPATIFLGDTGSMLIGLVLGTLAIHGSFKGPATVALAAPVAIFAIPIFDSLAAVIRRRMTGRSIYSPDRGHLHHLLLKRGLSSKSTLLSMALLCAATAAGGIASSYLKNELFAVLSALTIAAALVVSGVFGLVEFQLITHRLRALGESLTSGQRRRQIREQQVRLQGSRNWGEIWNSLTDFAQMHDLARVQLCMNLPWLHENYHALWENPELLEGDDLWSSNVPLAAGGRTVGQLKISGALTSRTSWEVLSLFAELLEALEPALCGLLEEGPSESPAARPAAAEPSLITLPPSSSSVAGVATRS